MNIAEAAHKLREMYDNAPEGEKATQIHLFGIKYAEDLARLPLAEVLEQSGLLRSYVTEVNKGRNLAKHVEVRQVLS